MGCAKSKETNPSDIISESVDEVVKVDGTFSQDELQFTKEIVGQVEGLRRQSQHIANLVVTLERKVDELDQRLEGNEKVCENIHEQIDSLAKKSRSIRKTNRKGVITLGQENIQIDSPVFADVGNAPPSY